MGNIQMIGGKILMVDGKIAKHENCCCGIDCSFCSAPDPLVECTVTLPTLKKRYDCDECVDWGDTPIVVPFTESDADSCDATLVADCDMTLRVHLYVSTFVYVTITLKIEATNNGLYWSSILGANPMDCDSLNEREIPYYGHGAGAPQCYLDGYTYPTTPTPDEPALLTI